MTPLTSLFLKLSEEEGAGCRVEDLVPLSKKTTFRIGGCADTGLFPKSESELVWALETSSRHSIPFEVLGRGSNTLADDEGFRGAVIFTEELVGITVNGTEVEVAAGTGLTPLARDVGRLGLSGLEFACGIPGSVGGAVLMNAGAYGGEMKDVLVSCRVWYRERGVVEVSADDAALSYRHSSFMTDGGVILSVRLSLKRGDSEQIRARHEELLAKRREKQPLELPSAGSAFKRPEGYFAAKLIEDAGLKGFALGGAAVSDKHSGFVVNRGGATSRDVLSLMEHVRSEVLQLYGVLLEPEFRYLSPKGEELF